MRSFTVPTALAGAAAFAALLAPGAAAAKDDPAVAGSIEFMLAPVGTFESKPDKGDSSENDLTSTFGIIPAIDKIIGRNIAFGAECMFVWAKPDNKELKDQSRQLILSPHVRARMSFPIVDKFSFDGLLGIGPTIWTGQDLPSGTDSPFSSTRFGWSMRFNFGASYKLNKSVDAFGNIGYYTTTSFGDDMEANINVVPVGVGLRGGF